MTNQWSYYVKNQSPRTNREFERLKYQAELTGNKEAKNLSWLGIQDGMSMV